MSSKTKQMLIVWTSTAHGRCKLPFGNSLFVVWGLLNLERLICLLSRSSVCHLNFTGNTCQESLRQTPPFDLSVLETKDHRSCILYPLQLSVQNGVGICCSLVWPPLTLARCVSRVGPASAQGRQNEGWVCPARHRPEWSELCGCVGWGLEGGEWRTDLEPTVQLLQQVWLVLGAQRQLCFSSNSG